MKNVDSGRQDKETTPNDKNISQERKELATSENDDNINDLHLSEVKIMKWSVPKPKDTFAMEKVKQVCSSLDGDDIYHYENIDDFDDTSEESKRVLRKGKTRHIYCKYFVDENDVCTPSQHCGGRRRRMRFDLEWYIVGEIARGCDTIRCYNKGCPNIYDPWDVVCLLGTKDIYLWYETVAFDPDKGRKKNEHKKQAMKTSTKVAPEIDESAQKETKNGELDGEKHSMRNWWRKNKRSTKQVKQSSVKSEPKNVSEETTKLFLVSEDSDHKQHQYECETCLTGFDEDPRKETAMCDHYTCAECLEQYFENQVTNLITKIECPRPDCHEQYPSKFIKSMLSSNLRVTYSRLYNLRLELEKNDKEEAMLLQKVCKMGPECTEEKCMCKDHESPEWWIEKSKRFAFCPACDTLVEKMNDGGCNNVTCGACKFSFCWICKKSAAEASHLMHCSLFGYKKYSKKRVVFNYLACGSGVVIGGPIVAGLLVGSSVTFVSSIMLAGVLSPPYYLSKKAYKYHKKRNSSKAKRIMATIGAAGLGVIGLPVLSIWGVCKTIKIVGLRTANTMMEWLDEPEPEKELPDEYNEKRKADSKAATSVEETTTDRTTSSSSAQQHQEHSEDDAEHNNKDDEFHLGNENDEFSIRKPKKRRFSEISRSHPVQIPLMVMPKESGSVKESEV